jgi:WD40 repeat protein
MHNEPNELGQHIVPATSRSLALRSAALVARGLRDLTHTTNWLIKKSFAGRASHFAISATGKMCALLPSLEDGVQGLGVYELEGSHSSALTLSPAGNSKIDSCEAPAAFAWSPTARYLVAASNAWHPEMQVFDFHANLVLGGVGTSSNCPNYLEWSGAGGFFAASLAEGSKASLVVWNVSRDRAPFSGPPNATLGTPEGCERQTSESEFGDEGAFSKYGKIAFSPDEKSLAVVLEYKGEWADDSLLITDAQSLRARNISHARGHITDVSWTSRGRQTIYCAGGKAYRLTPPAMDCEELSFAAELCACHPFLPICVCFSSWLKNSSEGRLCVFDLERGEMLDECAAEGVVALRWSGDGSKAYALTQDGFAYIYESQIF